MVEITITSQRLLRTAWSFLRDHSPVVMMMLSRVDVSIMTYSMDLRGRVVAAMNADDAIAAGARRLGIQRSTVRDWRDWRDRATLIVNAPMNKATFEAYAPHCPAPALRPGDVAVMDNLIAHKPTPTRQAIESADASLRFLPLCGTLKAHGLTLGCHLSEPITWPPSPTRSRVFR